MMKMKTEIHNSSFLISPTMHHFPLSGQSGSRGVSIKITLKYKIWNMKFDNSINYTTLQTRSMLFLKKMNEKVKKRTRMQIPPGGMGNGLERAYSKIIFIKNGYNIREII